MKRIQHIFTVMALVAILFHSGAYTVIFLDFQFNQSYIASTLCVNRFQPELKCEGKCHLQKRLTEQEKQQTDKGMLTVQESLTWVSETALLTLPTAKSQTAMAPVASYQSFFNQYQAVPRPHPPCQA